MTVYTYLLYPAVLCLIYSLSQIRSDLAYLAGRKDRRPCPLRDEQLMQVSIIIPAYNEEAHLKTTLASLKAIDYPAHLMEIIIASDGSTDHTNEILRGLQNERSRMLIFEERRGKATVLNVMVREAKNEILVFSDASTQFAPDAVRKLVRHFSNTHIGVVCGAVNFVRSAESKETEGRYWSYETTLRLMESRLGATLTASGAIYAVRRACYTPLEADTLVDDLMIPMRARRRGYEVVYDPEAKATEFAASAIAGEARRRTRIATGSFRALPELLRTPMPKVTFFAFVSHKLLRWLVPFLLIGLLVSNAFLLSSPLYRVIFAGQAIFYLWAGLSVLLRKHLLHVPYALLAYFLVSMNFAFVKGFFHLFSRREGQWERVS